MERPVNGRRTMRTVKLLRLLVLAAFLCLLPGLVEPAPATGPDQHTLTVLCGDGGSVSVEVLSGDSSSTFTAPGVFVLDDGVDVILSALPKAGWQFMRWTGSMASGEKDFAFTLTCDQDVQAHFVQHPRTLVVTCDEGGEVTQPGIGSFIYQPGTTVTVKATVKPGYRFAGWTGTLADQGDIVDPNLLETTIVVNEHGTLRATFEPIRDLFESWETSTWGLYVPAKSEFILADAGTWSLDDAISESDSCGSSPHSAQVVTLGDDQALLLSSVDSKSRCSDIVSVSLAEAGLVNPGFAVTVDADTMISFHEAGVLDSPGLHDPARDCRVPPCFDNVSLLLGDNQGNVLAYVMQRAPDATAGVSNTYFGGTYRAIFLDRSALEYRRNLLADLQTIPAFEPKGAQIRSIEFRVDAHGSALIDDLTIGSASADTMTPVYRFWSPSLNCHLYTADAGERQNLIDEYSSLWTFEGIAFFGPADDRTAGAKPVYRFWSPVLLSYLYTSGETERDTLLRDWPDAWTFEGVAFYVYAEDVRPAEAVPVYRFWSGVLGSHFYTISESERDGLVATYPDIWTLEGVAWYACPPQWDSGGALAVVRDGRTFGQAPTPVEVIVDNSDAGASFDGIWYVSSREGCWGRDSVTTTGEGSTFTWTADLVPWTTYAVYAWWAQGPLRYTTVPYQIHNGSALLDTVVVDQTTNGGQWNLLGVFSFTRAANVTISADPASVASVNADAVKFVPMSR